MQTIKAFEIGKTHYRHFFNKAKYSYKNLLQTPEYTSRKLMQLRSKGQ